MSDAAESYEIPTMGGDEPSEAPQGEGTILSAVEAAPTEGEQPAEEYVNTPEPEHERPEWLPEKFKTPEDLVKAYNEMGAKIREKSEPPDQYDIKLPEDLGELAEADVEAFKDMGLTNEQAQKLVDYFVETTLPALQEARVEAETARLASTWDMEENSQVFAQRLEKIKAWANQNLPPEAAEQMARTHNGVDALFKMMQSGASVMQNNHSTVSRPDPTELAQLMNDERYINRDPDYMEYVRRKYQEAYD